MNATLLPPSVSDCLVSAFPPGPKQRPDRDGSFLLVAHTAYVRIFEHFVARVFLPPKGNPPPGKVHPIRNKETND